MLVLCTGCCPSCPLPACSPLPARGWRSGQPPLPPGQTMVRAGEPTSLCPAAIPLSNAISGSFSRSNVCLGQVVWTCLYVHVVFYVFFGVLYRSESPRRLLVWVLFCLTLSELVLSTSRRPSDQFQIHENQ